MTFFTRCLSYNINSRWQIKVGTGCFLIIYADILFTINLLMDFIVLYVCSKVLRFNTKNRKMILGALVGALYSFFGLYVQFPEPITAVVVSVIMCLISFGKMKPGAFVKTLVMFYSAGFLAGGIITFLYNTFYVYRNSSFFKNGLKPEIFFVFSGISFVIISVILKIASNLSAKKKVWVEMQISQKKNKYCLLCDSGNLLKDPYNGLPVIIMPENKLKTGYGEAYNTSNLVQNAVRFKTRYIPVKTINGNSVLPGFIPDRITLIKSEKETQELKAVVAVTGENLGANDYDGIIPYTLASGL